MSGINTPFSTERHAQLTLIPVYEKRRQVTKAIPKFWPVALMNHNMFAFHVQHSADQLALSHLEDLWVARDPKEPRCYTVEFVRVEHLYVRYMTFELNLFFFSRWIVALQGESTLF